MIDQVNDHDDDHHHGHVNDDDDDETSNNWSHPCLQQYDRPG